LPLLGWFQRCGQVANVDTQFVEALVDIVSSVMNVA
jgi:hypothetical protein